MASAKKTKSPLRIVPKDTKLSFDTDVEVKEDNSLQFRPESIVRLKEENGLLPEDYNPYDIGYKIDKPKFLGDEIPFDQFGDGIYRKWEVMNNNDDNLTPVYFSLPKPPKDITKIDGYGLDRDEQYFRRLEMPRKFRQIESHALRSLYDIEKKNRQDTVQGYKFYVKFWEIVDQEIDKLEDEIRWLKNVWWWRTYGYWYFNDGELVFLPPDYFDFLNFYHIAEAECYPEYRDDVRRKYDYSWYLEDCTETFKDLDETGKAIKNEEGRYEMIDLGRRLFFGDVEPKTRRTGATHEAVHKILKGAMTNLSYFSTIISFEGNNAEVHYKKKLLPAFDSYPMALKPIWEGNRRPTVLRLDAPPNVYHIPGLKSAIAFSDSGGLFKNEGDRLNGVLNDEQGKGVPGTADIFERWHVNKYTMSTGMGINILKGAYVKNPSTVEQMADGSVPYYKLCTMSDFYRRIPVKGQTAEGFARIFLPAYLRLEGFIDRFGKSVVDTPTERQMRLSPYSIFAMQGKGGREMMQSERDSLLAQGTPEAMEAYRSIRRKSPFEWAECWLGSAGNVGLNMEIIDKRLSEINKERSFGRPPYRTGNLYREGGDKDGKVLWRDDNEKGRWDMSIMLPDKLTNQKVRCEYFDPIKMMSFPAWRPLRGHLFTCGADPFRSITKNEAKEGSLISGNMSNSRQSDGGLTVYWEYDETIDGGKSIYDRESDRTVCTYRARPPSQEEYFEDMLMTIQYFGAMLYPEWNVDRIVNYVIERGYWGYFLFDISILTGKPNAMPGRCTSTNTWQEAFPLIKDYIEFRGHKERHDKLLNEMKRLKGVESMTHLDLLASFCMAKFGSLSRHREIISKGSGQQSIDLSKVGMFRKRRI